MIDPIFQSDNYLLARKLLDASVTRQEAIASNIANADTPGYHRIDLAPDFTTQLRNQMNAPGGIANATTQLQPQLIEDKTVHSMRPDGNTVEVEREMVEMNRNSVEYDYLTEIVSRDIKQMRMAITGRSA